MVSGEWDGLGHTLGDVLPSDGAVSSCLGRVMGQPGYTHVIVDQPTPHSEFLLLTGSPLLSRLALPLGTRGQLAAEVGFGGKAKAGQCHHCHLGVQQGLAAPVTSALHF